MLNKTKAVKIEQKLWNYKIKNILSYIEVHDKQFLSCKKNVS
jgi:hypothetical protein